MKKFKKAYVEITNICNLDCNFCPKTNRNKLFMNTKDFEAIIIQVKKFTSYVHLHLMGEPTLHPDLKKILDICEKYNIKAIITTNGTLIDKVGNTILESKAVYKTVFSLHSYEANESGFSLYNYLNAILDFCLKASKQTDIICALRLWNLDSNDIKGENVLNDDILKYIYTVFNYRHEKFKSTSRDIKLAENVYLQLAGKFKWPDKKHRFITDKVYCHALKDHFGVLCDGTVVACCLDNDGEISLGNCLETNLEDILTCDKAKKIANGFSNRIAHEELCKRCEFVTRFKK